jgi:hypothetical protein
MKPNNFIARILIFVLIILPLFYFLAFIKPVQAGTFTSNYVRLDRVKASTATTGLVCATTPAADNGTEADVQVTFPTGFTVSTTVGNWTVATTSIPSGATAWPGIGTATAAVGQVVTFPSTALATSTLYCFRWTSTAALTNATAANNLSGTVGTRTGAAAAIDSGNYAVSVIAEDQISVTATVPLIFTLALSGTSMPLGTLSTSTTTSSTARTVSIGTNAAAGWIAWVKGANGTTTIGALTSTVASSNINAPDSCANNTPVDLASNTGYVLDVDLTTDGAGTGTITQAANFGAEYAGANATSGGSVCTDLQPIAASNGTTDGDVLTLTARAKVTSTQAAATDYADTLTVIATGRF